MDNSGKRLSNTELYTSVFVKSGAPLFGGNPNFFFAKCQALFSGTRIYEYKKISVFT